jgi:hypothetical protein
MQKNDFDIKHFFMIRKKMILMLINITIQNSHHIMVKQQSSGAGKFLRHPTTAHKYIRRRPRFFQPSLMLIAALLLEDPRKINEDIGDMLGTMNNQRTIDMFARRRMWVMVRVTNH